MNTKQAIRKALKSIMSEGEANAANIFKGWAYDGYGQHYGWHFTRFGGHTTYLGASKAEALAFIEQVADYRAEVG